MRPQQSVFTVVSPLSEGSPLKLMRKMQGHVNSTECYDRKLAEIFSAGTL